MSFASRSHSTLCQLYLGGGSVLVGEMSIVVIIGKWSVHTGRSAGSMSHCMMLSRILSLTHTLSGRV
jgi:hypothetical protein